MAELYRSDIVDVDINKSLLRTYAGIVLATGDKNANRFGAYIFRAGETVDLTGCDVSGYFIRPNMETVYIKGATDGSMAYVDLPEACYTSEGAFSLALKISGADITQTVRVVDGCIRLTQTGTIVDPGDVVPSLEDLFAAIATMETATEEARAVTEANQTAADECRAVVQEAAALTADSASPIIRSSTGHIVKAQDSADARALPVLSVFGRSTQSGTPTEDAPVSIDSIGGDDGSVAVEITGRNLYNTGNIAQSSSGGAKCTYTVTEDGWVDITSQKQFDYLLNDRFFAGGTTYTTRFEVEVYDRPEGETGLTMIVADVNGSQSKAITANGMYTYIVKFTPATSGVYRIRTYANYNSAVPAKVRFRTTCIAGDYTEDTMPAWTAYDGQSVQIPHTLRGVPVVSGGNYTDADGQQWIADEVDFSRGVYVQRIQTMTLDGSSTVKVRVAARGCFYHEMETAALSVDVSEVAPVLCTHLTPSSYSTVLSGSEDNTITTYGKAVYFNLPDENTTVEQAVSWLTEHPLTLLYALAEPVETALDAETLTAYAELRSRYPVMHIMADGAWVQVEYIADTQTYIDNRSGGDADYSANAGYAETAGNAEAIGGMGVQAVSLTDWASITPDSSTIYLIYDDEEAAT